MSKRSRSRSNYGPARSPQPTHRYRRAVLDRPSPVQTWPLTTFSNALGFSPEPAFDLRTWNFEQPRRIVRVDHPHRTVRPIVQQKRPASGRSTVAAYQRANSTPWASLASPVPSRTLHCIRRKERKQVLFAKRLTRKGAGSSRRHTELSSIGC